jgi:predicted MFS family arabinose efflux permease
MKEITKNPMYRFLVVLTISSTAGLQAWLILFNNFAVEIAALEGRHVGVIQSVREIPGFLSLLVVFVLLVVREHRLSALSILFLGVGLAATGLFPSYGGLLLTSLVMSFGFHYYDTTKQSLTLQYFDDHQSPRVFGKLLSLSSAASIGIGVFIYLVSAVLDYRQMFLLTGGLVVAAGLWGMAQDPTDPQRLPQRKRMVFRRRYWLFYFLTFMAGARRQIFMAFAVFLMVKRFQFSVQEVTALFVINNLINYFLSPMIGRSIIRFGERKVLSLEYASLIPIFLAYAVVESKILLALLYVLDHIFFNFSFAIRTYFQKIGDPRDIAPSMAVGFTINHIAAVVLPAIGGALWMIDYRIPFVAGAAMSLVSLMAVQCIRVRKK